MSNLGETITNVLSSIFNYSKGSFEKGEESLNTTLGKLRIDIKRREQRLGLALGAPIVVRNATGGGALKHVSNNDGTQYGGGIGDYSSPDKPVESIFSTAKIIARVFKNHEDELLQSFEEPFLRGLEDLLKDLHRQEKVLFEIINRLSQMGELDAGSYNVDNVEQAIREAREAHAKAVETRDLIFARVRVA